MSEVPLYGTNRHFLKLARVHWVSQAEEKIPVFELQAIRTYSEQSHSTFTRQSSRDRRGRKGFQGGTGGVSGGGTGGTGGEGGTNCRVLKLALVPWVGQVEKQISVLEQKAISTHSGQSHSTFVKPIVAF